MHTVGRHLIVELYDCPADRINDLAIVRAAVLACVKAIGAAVVGETYHHFTPQGVSATVLIAESHISLHTWPEAGYAAADIYSCGALDPRLGVVSLAKQLEAGRYSFCDIVRGLKNDILAESSQLPKDVVYISNLLPNGAT